MFAQHQGGLRKPDGLWSHDFVSLLVLEHSVLVDAGLVREGVRADHGFVRLHHYSGVFTHHAAAARDLSGVDTVFKIEDGPASVQCHHHFLQRGVAGALADAVDGDLRLARTGADAGEGVCCRHPEVIVAMHRDDDVLDAGGVGDDSRNQRTELVRGGVADRVGNVERGRAALDGFRQHHVQEFRVAAPGVLRAEFHVFAIPFGVCHHLLHPVDYFLRIHAQFVAHVDLGGGQKGVNAGAVGGLNGLPRGVDVFF